MAQATPRDEITKIIKVLVADDNQDFCTLLEIALNNQIDIRLVQTLPRADEIQNTIERLKPDILIIDLSMPSKSPLEAIQEVSLRYPALGVIALSAYDDKETIDNAIAAGAVCYIKKLEGFNSIIAGVRQVARNLVN